MGIQRGWRSAGRTGATRQQRGGAQGRGKGCAQGRQGDLVLHAGVQTERAKGVPALQARGTPKTRKAHAQAAGPGPGGRYLQLKLLALSMSPLPL